MNWCWPALLYAALSIAWPSAARAQSPARGIRTSALSWVRAPGAEQCVTAQALARRVEEQLGPVFVPPADADLSIEGLVVRQREPQGFIVRISVSGRDGQPLGSRELRAIGGDCRTLDEPTALVIALAIDRESAFAALPPSLVTGMDAGEDPAAALLAELFADEPTPPQAEPGRAEPVRARDVPPPRPPPPPAPLPTYTEFEAAMHVGLFVLREPSVAPSIGLGHLGLLPVPLGVRLRYWLPQEVEANGVGGEFVTLELWQLALLACPFELAAVWNVALCAGLQAGLLHVAGGGFEANFDEIRDAWSATLELRGRAALGGGFALRFGLSAQVTLNAHDIRVPDASGRESTLFTTDPIGVSAELGLLFAL